MFNAALKAQGKKRIPRQRNRQFSGATSFEAL